MRLLYTLALPILQITLLPHLALAKAFPGHPRVVPPAYNQTFPGVQVRRRALVHGLPPGWTAVFETVTSIQPPLINPVFVHFFSAAAYLAARDPVPGRHRQRIPFGSLVLEFIANGDVDQTVTKEFVVAASIWLRDAAQKGWTGLFKAWVLDQTNGDLVFVRLGTIWDEMLSLTY